jgi:hypothetical protein
VLPGLRVAYLVATVLLLVAMPFGDPTVLLALFVAVDLATAALLLARLVDAAAAAPQSVVSLGDYITLPLFRRTVPGLRSRRPAIIIESQVAWRQAADFRRRHGVVRRAPRAAQPEAQSPR